MVWKGGTFNQSLGNFDSEPDWKLRNQTEAGGTSDELMIITIASKVWGLSVFHSSSEGLETVCKEKECSRRDSNEWHLGKKWMILPLSHFLGP